MFFDAHIHSMASPDSEMDPVDVVLALKSKGLGTTFTEHVDFVTPTKGKDLTATDAPKGAKDFVCDFDMYPARYRYLRSNSVLLGLEIALTAAYHELNIQTASQDYDFILGSIHFVDGYDIFYETSKMEAESFCCRYLTYSLEMVELCGFFDSFAHIDYITRYSEQADKHFIYHNYPKEFDALLKAIADRDLAIEINTARFANSKAAKKLLPIYIRFRELGGRYVTIGSDAHKKFALGRFYGKAVEMAKMAGLTPVYYKNRKRLICKPI